MGFFQLGKGVFRLKKSSPQSEEPPDELIDDYSEHVVENQTLENDNDIELDLNKSSSIVEAPDAISDEGDAFQESPIELDSSDSIESSEDKTASDKPTAPVSLLSQLSDGLNANLRLLSNILPKRRPSDAESSDESAENPVSEDEADAGGLIPNAPSNQWFSLNTAPTMDSWWSPKSIWGAVEDLARRRTLTLTVENGVVRVVVFQGTKVVAWGTAHPLEDGKTNTELGTLDEGFASRAYSLLGDMGFKRLRLITELPLYSPLIRYMALPNMKTRYFNEVVQSELLDTIPFSSEEIDVVWQRRGDKSGHEVLAVVVPKSGIDHHIEMLRQANFRPGATYAKAISLAASVGQADVIIVYASVPQAAVVLVRGGFPRVVHQVDLPDDFWPYREHAQLLSEAIEQVSGYEATVDGDQNQESPLAAVLIGPLAAEDEFAEEFRRVCKREIFPFLPGIDHPEYFSPSEYASNIGLILADRMKTKSGGRLRGQNLPAVNLMAQRHLPKPLPFKPIAVFMSIAIFGAVAFNMTPKVDSTVLEASSLATEVDSLEQRTRLRRLNQAKMDTVQEQIEVSSLLREKLETRLSNLETDVHGILDPVEALTDDAKPFGLRVSTLSMQGDEVSLSGTALSYESVIEYTANLRDLGTEMFSNVRVQRVASSVTAEAGNPDVFVLFQVKATLPESLGDADEDDEQGTGVSNTASR